MRWNRGGGFPRLVLLEASERGWKERRRVEHVKKRTVVGEVLQITLRNGIVPALLIAALLTLLLQPFLRIALFPDQKMITITERVRGSVFLILIFVLIVLTAFAVALTVIHLAWTSK